MDSLSYTLLVYFSYFLALFIVTQVSRMGRRFVLSDPPWYFWKVLFPATILLVFQDVLIDPVSLRDFRWFPGQIYYYPEQGVYFRVLLSNFVGCFIVGVLIIFCFQRLDLKVGWSEEYAGNAIMGPVFCSIEDSKYLPV